MTKIEMGHMVWTVEDNDVNAFRLHWAEYQSVLGSALSREGYQALCEAHDVEPRTDDDLSTSPGLEHADWGMYHYHTDPENRVAGIAGTIHQRRFWTVRAKPVEDNDSTVDTAQKPTGQLWEPCEQCGNEPSLLPLHLCENCW